MNGVDDWRDWNPGLDNDGQTLSDLYDTFPELPPENHAYLQGLQQDGGIDLDHMASFRQDCLHIILGRGLLAQDEAFVTGFAMGAALTLRDWENSLFRIVAKLCYPGIYKFTDSDLKAYNLGINAGRKLVKTDLAKYDFKKAFIKPLGQIREELGIERDKLHRVYREEKELITNTTASRRLFVG